MRLQIAGGMNLRFAPDAIPAGKYAYLQNVRKYLDGRITDRVPQGLVLMVGGASLVYPASVNSMRRLNDSTPAGPPDGFSMVVGAGNAAYLNANPIIPSGLSGNPLSMMPFRPNASPQPWMYVGDSTGMFKTTYGPSLGTVYKVGIAEPQRAPIVSSGPVTTTGSFTMNVNAVPWTNAGGANAALNYGETSWGTGGSDGGPAIIGGLTPGSTLAITASGTATVNGAAHAPGDGGPSGASYPGHFISGGAKILLGAFTDANGNVVPSTVGGNVYAVYNVGASASLTVPPNAVQFQIGVDSAANTFYLNSGTYSVSWTLTTAAVATKPSLAGIVTAYVWGDSPHSGPVGSYIWKNGSDGGSGTTRTVGSAVSSATGTSLIFDSTPEDGTVPVMWTTLDSSGNTTGSFPLFTPAMEVEGYQDFNVCIVGNLFIPAAGSYTLSFTNKDQIMVGLGGGASVVSSPTGYSGQTMSVVNALPLVYVSVIGTSGAPGDPGGTIPQSGSVSVSFPSQGVYPIEIDWVYWQHSGRQLSAKINGLTVPPLQEGQFHVDAQYRYIYRSSRTGAVSNPSPETIPYLIPFEANQVSSYFSTDPQVDLVDYYRVDQGLSTWTYVATGPNDNLGTPAGTNTPITDTLTDLAIANNPILQFDNFEPFPSIDMPKKGVVNVGSGGRIDWVSGDQFNTRWLPGTVITIGSPTSIAYTFATRPEATTFMYIAGVQAGNNLVYQIPEPKLAAQPMPAIWGPTDNVNFYFGCGDSLRPGTLYWCKGNNFDSAPDTNQQDVTSPSEPLMNGVIVGGIGMVFSTERAWLIYPTFTSALATVEGVTGNAFSLTESGLTRGLYIRSCISTDGGGRVFFRAKDGICMSAMGSQEEVVTEDIFNLFPHEGLTPVPVSIDGFTVYPPDDTRPGAQTLAYAKGYLYYDYEDASGTRRTLVYDTEAGGWSVDAYFNPVSCHYWEEGVVNDVLVGTALPGPGAGILQMGGGGIEAAQSVVATPSINGGDPRVLKILGDMFFRAIVKPGHLVGIEAFGRRYNDVLTGFIPNALNPFTGTSTDYLLDFTSVAGSVEDVGVVFQWDVGATNILDYWQVDWSQSPEAVGGWKTDFTGYGEQGGGALHGWLHVAYFNLAYSSTLPVTVTALTSEGQTITMTFPATGGTFRKQYQIVPANKFKLISWNVSGGGTGFRLDAADSEMAIKSWGETGPYHVLRPFAGQSPQKGAEV